MRMISRSWGRRGGPSTRVALLLSGLLVVLGALVPGGAWADIVSNLTLHWPADEGTGTSVTDASGGGRTGLLNGGVTWVTPGKVGAAALSFDGTSGYMSFTALTTDITFTIALWLFPIPSSATDAVLLMTANCGNGLEYLSNQQATYYDTSYHSSSTFSQNAWHHVAASVSAGALTFYIDGATAGTGTVASTSPAVAGGTAASGCYYKGYLDDIRVYSRALSSADVGELIALAAARPPRRRPLILSLMERLLPTLAHRRPKEKTYGALPTGQ